MKQCHIDFLSMQPVLLIPILSLWIRAGRDIAEVLQRYLFAVAADAEKP